jgi:hypothetical protein
MDIITSIYMNLQDFICRYEVINYEKLKQLFKTELFNASLLSFVQN